MDVPREQGRTSSIFIGWRERSTRSARIPQWHTPAVDAVCAALESGDTPLEALRQLGAERALADTDLDAALELARRNPAVQWGRGGVEVRPVAGGIAPVAR